MREGTYTTQQGGGNNRSSYNIHRSTTEIEISYKGLEDEAADSFEFASENVKDSVLCPLCKRCNLHQLGSVLFCRCSFRMDVMHDGLSLNHLRFESPIHGCSIIVSLSPYL